MACSECGDKKTCQACVMESALLAMRDITREKTARRCAEIADRQLSTALTHRERELLATVRNLILREYRIGAERQK